MNAYTGRREFIQILLGGAAGLTLTWPAFGRGAIARQAPITVTRLTDRIALFANAGGNVGVVTASDGLLMVDGGLANRAADLAAEIARLSPRAVQVLFNTHYHGDHVGSNEALGRNHVRIIAHENVKARLGQRIESQAFGRTMEPLAAVGHPTETFSNGGKLSFGQEALEYAHVPPAHTDGDAYVFFPGANILHTGDLLFRGRYPVVDYSTGGSLGGMAAALDRLDKVGDDATRIIPGHGPLAGKADLRATRDMWVAINDRLEKAAKEGKTIEEVLAAAPTKDFDAQLGVADPSGFVKQAYGGVLFRKG